MKKKGFTLVELLAVIAIIALIAILALPNIVEMANKNKKTGNEMAREVVINAAKQYVRKNERIKNNIKEGTDLKIPVLELVNKGYLTDNESILNQIELDADEEEIDTDSTDEQVAAAGKYYVCVVYCTSTEVFSYNINKCACD